MLQPRLNRFRERLEQWWARRDPATRAFPGFMWRGLVNFTHYGFTNAAALAYYAIFSIFPLSLLVALFIGGLFGPAIAEQQVRSGLQVFLPDRTIELFESNVSEALQQGRSFTLIAIAGLIWSGIGLFSNITFVLDEIFHVPASRSLWRQRLIGFLMALMLLVLIVASFVTSGVLRLVSALLLDRPSSWVLVGSIFLPMGIDMLIFVLLFRFVPARHVYWDAVWPAAIFGAIGWEVLKASFDWYLDNIVNFQFVYGGIATVIVLLFWVYLIASIFLLSAELCAQLNEWLVEQKRREEALLYPDSLPLTELPPEVD